MAAGWIGVVFQQFNLFPHMTVERNLMIAPVEVRGVASGQMHLGNAYRKLDVSSRRDLVRIFALQRP